MVRRTVLIAIGANLPGPGGRNPRETCIWAVGRLAELPGLRLMACSGWYRSAPAPPSGQPDYVNGVVKLQGKVDALALLRSLQAIESEAGRVRTTPNAARTLDLDLLAMDALMLDSPALTLPHPRLHERAFVLAPLCDIAPEWTHPLLGRTAADLLATADRAGLDQEILAGSPPPP